MDAFASNMPSGPPVSLETLHVASATADLVEASRDALALGLARSLPAGHEAALTQMTADELISLLLTLASSATAARWDASAALRHAAEQEEFRDAAEGAFRDACRAELPAPVATMACRVWGDLLRAYLDWLGAPAWELSWR